MAEEIISKIRYIKIGTTNYAINADYDGEGNKIATTYAKTPSYGFATLDENGKVPSSLLPSYVDDIVEYADMDAFPNPGEKGKIYVNTTDNKTYRWSGTTYTEIPTDVYTKTEVNTKLDGKVDKVENKSLVSDTEITKLTGLKSQTEINNSIADAKKAGTDALTNLTNHINNTENPHQVTKAQVGLGNVDNTSDADKPISTATLTALDGKQATLVSGTNIKTINGASILGAGNISTAITIDSALNADSLNPVLNKVIKTELDTKVDKVTGKGLSTNDYTTAEKNKLANISASVTGEVLSIVTQ